MADKSELTMEDIQAVCNGKPASTLSLNILKAMKHDEDGSVVVWYMETESHILAKVAVEMAKSQYAHYYSFEYTAPHVINYKESLGIDATNESGILEVKFRSSPIGGMPLGLFSALTEIDNFISISMYNRSTELYKEAKLNDITGRDQ